MVQGRSDAAAGGRIRYGMVGGGQGAFIGAVHRLGARMDDNYVLVAGCLSSALCAGLGPVWPSTITVQATIMHTTCTFICGNLLLGDWEPGTSAPDPGP